MMKQRPLLFLLSLTALAGAVHAEDLVAVSLVLHPYDAAGAVETGERM